MFSFSLFYTDSVYVLQFIMVFVPDTVAMRQVYCEVTESFLLTCHSSNAIFIDHPEYGQVVAAAKER